MSENSLPDAIVRLAATPRLLVALDFDGTVSPLVDNPSESRVLPAARRAIDELEALPDTWVAFVSGRPLAGLVRVTEADESALLIASHGVEVRLTGGAVDVGLSDGERAALDALSTRLDDIASHTPGAFIEHKPVGLGLHTRGVADAADASRAQAEARAAAAELGGFIERAGKDILEFAVRDATKGDGIEVLRRHVDATGVFFAGDDVTDEDGFGVLDGDDVGLKVGDGATRAAHRAADPEVVGEVLAALASARAAHETA